MISRSKRDLIVSKFWKVQKSLGKVCKKRGLRFEEKVFENGAAAGDGSDRELNRTKTGEVLQLFRHLLLFVVALLEMSSSNPFIINTFYFERSSWHKNPEKMANALNASTGFLWLL